ncbi:MAG: YqaE/Pmp3 family membrane protein [Bacteroidia bacterium]|nr:YqaE/Pmp3 family membrane protein [Bacteroidia bacterium]
MKKTNYSIGVLALIFAAVIFLSSCSTVSLTQRKYNKGFHVEWASKQRNNSKAEKPKVTIVPKTDVVVNESIQNENVVLENTTFTNPVIENSYVAESGISNPITAAKMIHKIKNINKIELSNDVITSKTFSKTTFLKAKKAQKADSVDPLLLIVLAILLSPVAVYLYEGSWTNRCTVNLILWILCWLPGVIHALIVISGKK